MNVRIAHVVLLAIGAVLLFGLSDSVSAQNGKPPQTREITSDDFVKKRPAGKSSGNRRRKRYRYTRKAKKYRRRNSRRRPKNPASVGMRAQVGVTMWKLRPPRIGETGPFIPVQTSTGFTSGWTPERVGTNKLFRAGDRVRFAIESSIAGYLYIINSELYSDGTIGSPYLIFPASTAIDNLVRPGMLVDIPDQEEDNPYFLIQPKRSDYRGEALLIVISPKRLRTLKTDQSGRITSINILEELEEYSNAEIFSGIEGLGSVLTKVEVSATCGSRMRSVIRTGNKLNPCEAKSRQLTRESPPPQTIYRTKHKTGQPIAFPVILRVAPN